LTEAFCKLLGGPSRIVEINNAKAVTMIDTPTIGADNVDFSFSRVEGKLQVAHVERKN
jgi:hypothetical protein